MLLNLCDPRPCQGRTTFRRATPPWIDVGGCEDEFPHRAARRQLDGRGDALDRQGAERDRDGSHSHEVLLQTTLADGAGTEYPGRDALVERTRAACEAAFTQYVGRPPQAPPWSSS